jgi:hypothetical protein
MNPETDMYEDAYGPAQKWDQAKIGGGKEPTTLDKERCRCR